MGAMGGKVNKFDGGGYAPYAAMGNYAIENGGINGNPLNGAYKTWDEFVYGDNLPIWVDGNYIPEYGGAAITTDGHQNNGFYKWLKSDAGEAFRKNWWNKENAPNFYNRNDASVAPTMDDLIGVDGKAGLMFDKNYGDAHKFGAAAFNEYMKGKSPKDTAKKGQIFHAVVGDDDYMPESALDKSKVGREVKRVTLPNGDIVVWHASLGEPDNTEVGDTGKALQDDGSIVPIHKKEWPRYAGLMGPAVGLDLQAMGVGKPNTSTLDAAVSASGVTPIAADYKPLGNYLTYRPLDRDYYINKLNAQAGATRRALLNSGSTPSRAAAILAADNQAQAKLGDLARQAEEYNQGQREKVATFNRGTDQLNADAYNRAALQYASDYNNQKKFNAQLQMEAAREKMNAKAGWYNSLYANIGQLAAGIGSLGKENAQHNLIADMAASGAFAGVNPESAYWRRHVKKK